MLESLVEFLAPSYILIVILIVEVVLSDVELFGEVFVLSLVDFLDEVFVVDPDVLFYVAHDHRGAVESSAQNVFGHFFALVYNFLQF